MIWTQTAALPRFEPLKQDIKTDVLVIGGGIAGLLCAYLLDRAGVPCALAEAERICGGITKNTTAKITAQHGLIYSKLTRTFGGEQAKLYLHANLAALEKYRSLCQTIDCDFQTRSSAVYSLRDRQKIERELDALQKIGFPAGRADALPLPFPVAGAVCFAEQAQFHPLKFLCAIAKDLRIFENTRVLELIPGAAVTQHGTIRAEKIIVATHFPFLNKHGSYFLKLYQHRSYVLALQNAPEVRDMYVDESGSGLSFRSFGDLLLLGGGGHRTGKNGGGWRELESFARRRYPEAGIAARWATQDCMTLDGVPYVGQYARRTPNLYVATGFNKWGMTSAMAAAMLLTDLVLGKENPWTELFSPSRTIFRPQLAVNAAESAFHLLTPTVPRCPHMGCALKYNRQEHSWDCPCHGSRFTEDGRLIDNPATGDKKR
ncbi:MAG: FAD-dependent oxidoreductase [Oscillospiraceae bacterium]|nr:FAD-dependent oxidoreductase [Oscillospiraceae bacterium]